jgi:hypothetical protein
MKLKHRIMSAAILTVIAGFGASALAGEGKEETISLDQLPDAVHKALAAYAQDSEVKKVEKSEQHDKKVYEFDIDHGGKKFELTLSKKGKFAGKEEDIQLSDMPAAAQAALKAQAGDGTLSEFEKAEDKHHQITFEGTIEKGGKKTEVAVDDSGKVISTEDATMDKD